MNRMSQVGAEHAERPEPARLSIRVAAAPMLGIRSVADSCAHIANMISAAAKASVDILVLPETATNSYQPTVQQDRAEIERGTPMILDAVGQASGPWVILGTYLYHGAEATNSAVVIDPDGRIRATYHKMSDGGARWLMMDMCGVRCTVVVCSDLWVPAVLSVPKLLGARLCLYPHGSGAVTQQRRDWSALYYVRAWESKLFLVMADCSWPEGEPFTRPRSVRYPYGFEYHLLNQTCIISPEPRYLARIENHGREELLLADIDLHEADAPLDFERFAVGKPWQDLLQYYQTHGHVEWMT